MAFPWDYLDADEEVIIDTNPTFSGIFWPLLELMAITGIIWLLIGFIDKDPVTAANFAVARTLLMLLWVLLLVRRVAVPLLRWLRERFILTDRRILLRHGLFRTDVSSIDLRSVRGVRRQGSDLLFMTYGYGSPITVANIPSSRKVAKLVNRMT